MKDSHEWLLDLHDNFSFPAMSEHVSVINDLKAAIEIKLGASSESWEVLYPSMTLKKRREEACLFHKKHFSIFGFLKTASFSKF